MNTFRSIVLSVLFFMGFAPYSQADPAKLNERKIPVQKNIIVFPNDKGEVKFNHAIHSKKFKEDDCILCHLTNEPTRSKVMTRFDNHRVAHYFCKGCHREMGCGPTECHECHNYKKRK